MAKKRMRRPKVDMKRQDAIERAFAEYSGLSEIEYIALWDPRLAVALLGGLNAEGEISSHVKPSDPITSWAWEVVNLRGPFEREGSRVEVRTESSASVDLWIRKVAYAVRRPNDFFTNRDLFAPEQIDFTLDIRGHGRYVIAQTPMPLSFIESSFQCLCPYGFVLAPRAEIDVVFSRLKTGVEVEPVITMHGVRLPVAYDACTVEQATAALKKAGFYREPPTAPKRRRKRPTKRQQEIKRRLVNARRRMKRARKK